LLASRCHRAFAQRPDQAGDVADCPAAAHRRHNWKNGIDLAIEEINPRRRARRKLEVTHAIRNRTPASPRSGAEGARRRTLRAARPVFGSVKVTAPLPPKPHRQSWVRSRRTDQRATISVPHFVRPAVLDAQVAKYINDD